MNVILVDTAQEDCAGEKDIELVCGELIGA